MAETPSFTAESHEAWAYILNLANSFVPELYESSSSGLTCKSDAKSTKDTLEDLAFDNQLHPSLVAESIAAYFWNDWTLLHVEGYDIEEVVTEDADAELLGAYLEAFYQQHEPCLLTVMKVLIDGYEGYYHVKGNTEYVRLPYKQNETYELIALSTDYFPGTGVFEPLGIVYGVRLAALLKLDFVRKPAVDAISKSISKRIQDNGSALKLY